MNNNKLSIGNEIIDKELEKGISFEEFVKFNIGGELLPYQKQMLNFFENSENISREEFAEKYQLNRIVSFNKSKIISTPISNNELFNFHIKSVSKSKQQNVWTIIDDPTKKD